MMENRGVNTERREVENKSGHLVRGDRAGMGTGTWGGQRVMTVAW